MRRIAVEAAGADRHAVDELDDIVAFRVGDLGGDGTGQRMGADDVGVVATAAQIVVAGGWNEKVVAERAGDGV
ncbi:MAG: hypothetical protein CAPSK01_000802 [Candidatus Accumulibacter vicinus]|uniref:Uncharacterized protein n=1 Tax=Candidatus Accumulibacter vicinus TaxID=2954382 RepID=A0A084Y495_9PROT|nr:MAG: hypothetical protein CAPSK01_000802 [Candidatus Accumulibacter vicinus]